MLAAPDTDTGVHDAHPPGKTQRYTLAPFSRFGAARSRGPSKRRTVRRELRRPCATPQPARILVEGASAARRSPAKYGRGSPDPRRAIRAAQQRGEQHRPGAGAAGGAHETFEAG